MKICGMVAFLVAVVAGALGLVLFPMWVIRPFRPQPAHELMLAMQAREWAPLLTTLALPVVLAGVALLWSWTGRGESRAQRWRRGLRLGSLVVLATLSTAAARVNIFEWMFHSDRRPAFTSASGVKMDADAMLMTIRLNGEDRAYPITVMAYHRIVNDWIGETPVAATRWQQITGRAIAGPLKGTQLQLVPSEELSLGLWRGQHPDGMVLLGVPGEKGNYVSADWEKEIAKLPTVVDVPKGGWKPRRVILGMTRDGASRAWPRSVIRARWPVASELGGVPITFVLGPEQESIRAFRTDVGGEAIELFRAPGATWKLLDAQGDTWNFEGCATSGPRAGTCLQREPYLTDYWFDWHRYHPHTEVFRARH